MLEKARKSAQAFCKTGKSTAIGHTGGWCLESQNTGIMIDFPSSGIAYELAKFHSTPSPRVVSKLVDLFRRENITTVNDFGAGIAQYKSAITKEVPHLRYDAYDGAGNGEAYTKGMMEYIDLTLPLDLPVADWVISLEVGEHIPSKFEGMYIRNLHRHNTKGLVLSWAILGQGGHSHVNNHSNEYIIKLFESLGYQYDVELTQRMRRTKHNFRWFTRSVFVLRKV
ncbi:MAG: hypothetical protein SGBAC_001877 [Bacillariaceae sp.]